MHSTLTRLVERYKDTSLVPCSIVARHQFALSHLSQDEVRLLHHHSPALCSRGVRSPSSPWHHQNQLQHPRPRHRRSFAYHHLHRTPIQLGQQIRLYHIYRLRSRLLSPRRTHHFLCLRLHPNTYPLLWQIYLLLHHHHLCVGVTSTEPHILLHAHVGLRNHLDHPR